MRQKRTTHKGQYCDRGTKCRGKCIHLSNTSSANLYSSRYSAYNCCTLHSVLFTWNYSHRNMRYKYVTKPKTLGETLMKQIMNYKLLRLPFNISDTRHAQHRILERDEFIRLLYAIHRYSNRRLWAVWVFISTHYIYNCLISCLYSHIWNKIFI
jgi:hypothetical protein